MEAIETVRGVVPQAAEGDDPFILQDGRDELVFAVTEDGTISLGIESELKDEINQTIRSA